MTYRLGTAGYHLWEHALRTRDRGVDWTPALVVLLEAADQHNHADYREMAGAITGGDERPPEATGRDLAAAAFHLLDAYRRGGGDEGGVRGLREAAGLLAGQGEVRAMFDLDWEAVDMCQAVMQTLEVAVPAYDRTDRA